MRNKFPDHERSQIVNLAEETLWSNEGSEYLKYLREVRCISDDVIRLLKFGYVPPRSRHPELAGRLIMPLYDQYGKLAVITSRNISPDCPKDKKHWHESFEKSYYLYGLNVARESIIRWKKAIVVEGQFDVGYLWTQGFPCAVGICGSSLNLYQASLISRYCNEIYLFFDGDVGGFKATERSMNMYREKLLNINMKFYPVSTPQGKDPDDLSRQEIINLCKEAKGKEN